MDILTHKLASAERSRYLRTGRVLERRWEVKKVREVGRIRLN